MQGSKISLSPAEAALIGNAEIILTKNSIIQKTVALLSGLQDQLLIEKERLVSPSTPKISKGENYLGLPYVVLDYPRISQGDAFFFIRSMFWWGHFFSSTLQLAGEYKVRAVPAIVSLHNSLALQHYSVGIHSDPWQHHFETTNYRPLASLSSKELEVVLHEQPYIKIAARWPLSEWDKAANHLLESWKLLAGLVA
jgi:hypothetical protein